MSQKPGPLELNDGKAPDALRTIGEVADALGIRQHVLRYWEQQFPSLQPLKRSGGRRYYRREDVELIARIDQLVNREGYTLKGARQALESGKRDDAEDRPEPARVLASQSVSYLPQLRAIRDRLAAALA